MTIRAAATICACAALLGSASAAPANRERARGDAQALLGRLDLPPGSVRLAASPGGAAGAIDNRSPAYATPLMVDLHQWWRAPGRSRTVLRFLETHAPKGSTVWSSGSGSGGHGPTWWYEGYSFPPVAGVLGFRGLIVKLAPLSARAVALRVDAQVVWVVPRAASERIPAGVHEVDVVRDRAPAVSISVTRSGLVARIVALVNQLPIVQPGTVIACPAMPVDGPTVTLTFRARRGGAVLARAVQPVGISGPTTACDAMSLTIHGRRQQPLLGGLGALRAVGSLLGVTLAG